MEIIDDSRVRLGLGEVVTATSDTAQLSLDTGATLAATAAPERMVTIVAPRTPGRVTLRVQAEHDGQITLQSATGARITRSVVRGSNLFEFIYEPRPDEWFCENDDGDPPHPVSKGDTVCSYCGGRVLHGGR